jgi:hypothetical protein
VSLLVSLRECAARCEDVLESYFATAEVAPDTEFKRAMIEAIAAMRVAVAPGVWDGPARRDALRLVVLTAEEARRRLRMQGFERGLLLCAEECDRAARSCALALASERMEV